VTVSKDFSELFASFNAHQVRALVVGGYAFAFHARPRYTKDLDLWIEPSPDNVERLLRALADFGFGSLGLTVGDFERPGQFVQLGYPPNRIDLMTSIPGLTFEEAWAHRIEDRYGTEPVCFLAKDDLIRNKRAVGRRQDLLDLEILES
jgi:hypothetical protein